jgi:phospholipid/cholesterol/gamma-HCH transport system substrate-binding protein
MKKDSHNKIKLGIFISLGIAIFILGIYFIGERQQLFRKTFHIAGVFKNVSGLQAGCNVLFAGINVGTVENISIVSDTSVIVEIMIDENIRRFIKKDAVASIGSDGLMGNKNLILNPGAGREREIENNDTVETIQPINMDDILISLKTTIDNTSHITNDLSRITNSIQSGKGTVGSLLMDQSLAQSIDSTFVNLKESSAGFKILMQKAKTSWLMWGF